MTITGKKSFKVGTKIKRTDMQSLCLCYYNGQMKQMNCNHFKICHYEHATVLKESRTYVILVKMLLLLWIDNRDVLTSS